MPKIEIVKNESGIKIGGETLIRATVKISFCLVKSVYLLSTVLTLMLAKREKNAKGIYFI